MRRSDFWRGRLLRLRDALRPPFTKAGQPKVSALVSIYEASEWMDACLEDLTAQTLFRRGEMEVVVVDAASPGGEKPKIEAFQKKFPGKIRYRRSSGRITLYAAWNCGIQMARGEYLTSANVDDKHAPDALEKLAGFLDDNPDTGLVYADQLITRDPADTFEKNRATFKWSWPEFDPEILERRCIIGPQPVWRRSLHYRFGLFDPGFRASGDWEFWLRIRRSTTICKYQEVLGLYYQNPQGLERSNPAVLEELALIRSRYHLDHVSAEATHPVPVGNGS